MPKGKNIVAIIQARTGSSRLPGKILMDISGKPMLWHIVNRLGRSRLIDKIVIATTASAGDNAVEEFCEKHGIDCHRGSENDVLDRYYSAAEAYKADAVVRITGDCPLIDPVVVDETISAYLDDGASDMASNVITRRYPRGLDTEVISFKALKRAWNDARKDHQREHVTAYIYENIKMFNVRSVENKADLSHLRWTVDEKKDMELVREIYKRLYRKNGAFLTGDILKILKREPKLNEVNKNIKQKAAVK